MSTLAGPGDPPTPARKSPFVRRMFGRITRRYDLLNLCLSFGLDRLWRRAAVRELRLPPGGSAVDLCCGTGDVSETLARQVGRERVVGLDFVPGMIEQARAKYPGIRFLEGDALATGLEDARFDGASVAFALRNVDDVEALFREMRRLVRPGGRVVSLELTRPPGLLGVLHGLFLRWVVPLVGGVISGDAEAYRYLARSIATLLPVEEVAERMRRAGLEEVRIVPLQGGIATLHVGRRPLS